MHVQLILDQPQGQFTNLDVVSGRVMLRVPNPTTVSFITVKLEGESETRLLAPPRPDTNQKPRHELELHKLLYKVEQVFPPEQTPTDVRQKQAFQVGPGTYEYPFYFKIPFNNTCHAQSPTGGLSFGGFGVEVVKTARQHVKTTLPPTAYLPGIAQIKYFVKATVNRPSLLKENPRAIFPFAFIPIEPPRAVADGEVYARRQHQFHDAPILGPTRRPSLFKANSSSSPTTPISPSSPVRVSVDARLPNPAILTCGGELPLRILFKQLSERTEMLCLQNLHIELIGHTKIRAQSVVRTESQSWVIVSKSNMNHHIGNPGDPVDTETELTKEFWYGLKLPDTVPPSFITCNVSRFYELAVSVGMSYGVPKSGRDQFISLPLRIDLEVYSGIKPPDELLKRLATSPPQKTSAIANSSAFNPPNPLAGGLPAHATPGHGQPVPHAASSASGGAPPPSYEEAPPSYEEAIASDLPPLNGPRPGYRPPTVQPGDPLVGDRKER